MHEAVQAHRQLLVGRRLERFGRPRPRARRGRQRLGGDEVLAVDVSHRRRLADVGVRSRTARRSRPGAGPHRAIGTSVRALDLHAVADERAAAFVRLAVVAHPASLQHGR